MVRFSATRRTLRDDDVAEIDDGLTSLENHQNNLKTGTKFRMATVK